MRKLFLASMLTLGMAGAAFANDNKTEKTTSEVITPKVEVIQTVQKETKKTKSFDCFEYGFECGGADNICVDSAVGFWELVFILKDYEQSVCG